MPPELRARLQLQARMHKCALDDEDCDGRLEWHHAVIFGGSKLEVWWAVHALCFYHHSIADRKDIRAILVALMHKLGGDEVKEYEKIKRL